MGWNGSKIRERLKDTGLNLTELAKAVGVSRQAINGWIGGQVPRGEYLIKLSKVLGIPASSFFESETQALISVPQHRTMLKRHLTPEMSKTAFEIAELYLNLFRAAPKSNIVPVIRSTQRDRDNAKSIAGQLRVLSGMPQHDPMDFQHTFQMLKALGIYAVLRPFPECITKKIYAFYSSICGQRVIFINTHTNLLDLNFQLLHETIHAVRDENPGEIDKDEEERFCDLVATYVQFPDDYLDFVARTIKGLEGGLLINKLKEFARRYKHSLYGLGKALELAGFEVPVNIAAADTVLKKNVARIEEIIFKGNDARTYIGNLFKLSPLFISLVADQQNSVSPRKIGEWLGLESSFDSDAVINELERIKNSG